MTKLTLDDIADLRAYERERDEFRAEVIALKKRRRIARRARSSRSLFENRDTIRFQIQEMARVEKILTDEGIQAELDVYNPLIPEPGSLSATLFIELTTEPQLREWLPKLVGIERHVVLRIGSRRRRHRGPVRGRCRPRASSSPDDEITASVHYIHFAFTPEQVEAFRSNPVTPRGGSPRLPARDAIV